MSVLFSGNDDVNSAIKNYLDRKMARLGDFKYAYLILNKKNTMETLIISNYPSEWVSIYKKNNYQHIDPVVLFALQRESPFFWDENLPINSLVNFSKIFNLSKNYNIVNGYSFVLHDHNNNMAMLSIIMNNMKIINIEDYIEKEKARLQMLLITVHEKITSLLKTEPAIDLFTKSELHIVFFALQRYSSKEIARKLNLSPRTVENRLSIMYEKTEVHSLIQFIEYCKNQGLDNYIPYELMIKGLRFT